MGGNGGCRATINTSSRDPIPASVNRSEHFLALTKQRGKENNGTIQASVGICCDMLTNNPIDLNISHHWSVFFHMLFGNFLTATC